MSVHPIIEADFEAKTSFVDRLATLARDLGVARIIELGCGHGREATLLKTRGEWDVLATDCSAAMLAGVPPEVNPTLLEVTQPFPNEMRHRFDLAYCAFLVHLLPLGKRHEFYLNCFDCLRPVGIFVCLTASMEDLQRRFMARYFPTAFHIDMDRYRTLGENLDALHAVGFRDVRIENIALGTVVVDLNFYRKKLSSILRLIPEGEYRDGLQRMECDVKASTGITMEWRRTLLIAQKEDA